MYWGGRRAAPVVLNRDTTRQLNVPAAITRYQLNMSLGWTFRRYRTIQGCLFEPEVASDVSVQTILVSPGRSASFLSPDLEPSL
jgi:hypothetical protein